LTTTARLWKPRLRAMLSRNMTKHTDLPRNIDVLARRGNVERCSPVRIAERESMRMKVEIDSHSSSLGDSMSSTVTAPQFMQSRNAGNLYGCSQPFCHSHST